MALQSASERSITCLNSTDVCSIMSCWRTALIYLDLSKGKFFCTSYFPPDNQRKEQTCSKSMYPFFRYTPGGLCYLWKYKMSWHNILTCLPCWTFLEALSCYCHSFQYSVINLTKQKKCNSFPQQRTKKLFHILLNEDQVVRDEGNE